jgi:hypothetical protein
MKLRVLRNLVSVLIAAAWLVTGQTPASAESSTACDMSCSWSGGSCCNVGDLQCGSDGSGQGLCMYCFQQAGSQTATSCSAAVGEEEVEGTVCQCEGPGGNQ